jgi:hypothetical protein
MKYSPETIDKMKYHIIVKRIDQYMKYKKAMAEAIAKATKG